MQGTLECAACWVAKRNVFVWNYREDEATLWQGAVDCPWPWRGNQQSRKWHRFSLLQVGGSITEDAKLESEQQKLVSHNTGFSILLLIYA